MDYAFISTILMFGGSFEPVDWAFCDGQAMSIQSNTALFSLLGVTYGGNGTTTFNLPDMRGRVPMHPHRQGGPGLTARSLGAAGGSETVTLNLNQLPAHTHPVSIGIASGTASAGGNGKALSNDAPIYTDAATDKALRSFPLPSVGGNQPTSIMQPYLCVNFIICLQGVYPSRK